MRLGRVEVKARRRKSAFSRKRAESKEARTKLRASEKQYRTTVDSLLEALHVVDGRLKIVLFNKTLDCWCDRLGLPRARTGQALSDVFPFLPRRVLAEYRRVFRTRRTVVTEETLEVGGERITTETTKMPVLMNGQVERVVTVMRDITRRKEMEEALRKSEHRYKLLTDSLSRATAEQDRLLSELRDREQMYREIYNATSEAIAVEDALTGSFVEVNEPMIRMYGYSSREELMACSIGDLSEAVPPYTQEEAMRRHELVMAGSPQVFPWIAKRKNGELFNVEVSLSCSPIRGRNRTLAVVRDITERKQAEIRIRESEAALRAAQRVAHVGSWRWDIRSNRLEWSDEMYRIFGISKESFSGDLAEVIGTAIHPEDRAKVERSILPVTRRKRPAPLEYRVVRPDGTVRVVWTEADELTLNRAGAPSILTGIVQDITERRLAEAALQASHDSLERKVKERTAELRAMATRLVRVEEEERQRIALILHDDLQQLMTGARLMLRELWEQHPAEKSRRVTDRISQILDQATQIMRSLCHDLRPAVLYEGGLGAALQWLAADMKKFGLAVRVRADEAADAKSKELSVFLFGAVKELLFNVAKHAGVKRAQVTVGPAGRDLIRVEVQDRGKGFDPSPGKSAGFGLFHLRERAESFGGEMRIRSAPGKGTRITLTLPSHIGQS